MTAAFSRPLLPCTMPQASLTSLDPEQPAWQPKPTALHSCMIASPRRHARTHDHISPGPNDCPECSSSFKFSCSCRFCMQLYIWMHIVLFVPKLEITKELCTLAAARCSLLARSLLAARSLAARCSLARSHTGPHARTHARTHARHEWHGCMS